MLAAQTALWSSDTARGEFPPASELQPNAELPDPLTMLDGTKVTSREAWETKRKPELKALFQHYMYGRLPLKPARQDFEISEPRDVLGGKAELRDVVIQSVEPRTGHPIHVLLVTPKGVKQPPVFVGMNFCGNHAVLDDPQIPLPAGWVRNNCAGAMNERATDAGRGSQQDVWNIDKIVGRGYALACFYSGDVDPDTPDMTDGIGPTFYKAGQTEQGPDDAGTIALWAWGFHRVVDYLTQSPDRSAADCRGGPLAERQNGTFGRSDGRANCPGDSASGGLRRIGSQPLEESAGRDGEADQHVVPALVLRQLQGV
jgi:hypothetical protein